MIIHESSYTSLYNLKSISSVREGHDESERQQGKRMCITIFGLVEQSPHG